VPACQGWESTTSTSTSPSTSMSSRRANQAAVPSEYSRRDPDPRTAGYSASGSSYWLCEQCAPRRVIKSEGNGGRKGGASRMCQLLVGHRGPTRGAWRVAGDFCSLLTPHSSGYEESIGAI
jgi:hypothetical protein